MADCRLGILGGTFNPIHLGHLVLAEAFRERLGLDRVLFVPVGTPPHKAAGGLVSALHRYAMVTLAVAGHPGFVACPVEVERAGPSYSVDTVEALAGDWPGARLFFLMGSDTFLDLPSWRTPERLGAFTTLGVGYRAGSAFDPEGPASAAVLRRLGCRTGWRRVPPVGADGLAPGDCALVETRSVDVSARAIRERLAAGESARYQVPLLVAEYISQHRLYEESA
jgi:nicotinate-nucleotide adenylyltransferase